MPILIAILSLTVIGPSWAADGIVDQIMADTVAFSLDGIDAPRERGHMKRGLNLANAFWACWTLLSGTICASS